MTATTATTVRIVLKAVVLFVLLNVVYVATQPLNALNRLTLYNVIFPGRERLSFSNGPDSQNLIIGSIDHIVASHVIARPKTANEYRVVMIGDSAVWGYLLEPTQTQAACLNRQQIAAPDGKIMRFYNLGYPTVNVFKDMLILRRALQHQPDLVIWQTTLISLYPSDQLDFEIVRASYAEATALIAQHNIRLYGKALIPPTFMDQTMFGQRRAIADWLRHQLYGIPWAATKVDHRNLWVVLPRLTNLNDDENIVSVGVLSLKQERKITSEDLSMDILKAGIGEAAAKGVPVLMVNEPTFRSTTSPKRYNNYYPRWAYDDYRIALRETATREGWPYVDFGDVMPNDTFTDTALHLTPAATCDYAAKLAEFVRSEAAKLKGQ